MQPYWRLCCAAANSGCWALLTRSPPGPPHTAGALLLSPVRPRPAQAPAPHACPSLLSPTKRLRLDDSPPHITAGKLAGDSSTPGGWADWPALACCLWCQHSVSRVHLVVGGDLGVGERVRATVGAWAGLLTFEPRGAALPCAAELCSHWRVGSQQGQRFALLAGPQNWAERAHVLVVAAARSSFPPAGGLEAVVAQHRHPQAPQPTISLHRRLRLPAVRQPSASRVPAVPVADSGRPRGHGLRWLRACCANLAASGHAG